MQLLAFIAEPGVPKRMLDHLDSTGPPLEPPRVGQPDSVDVVRTLERGRLVRPARSRSNQKIEYPAAPG